MWIWISLRDFSQPLGNAKRTGVVESGEELLEELRRCCRWNNRSSTHLTTKRSRVCLMLVWFLACVGCHTTLFLLRSLLHYLLLRLFLIVARPGNGFQGQSIWNEIYKECAIPSTTPRPRKLFASGKLQPESSHVCHHASKWLLWASPRTRSRSMLFHAIKCAVSSTLPCWMSQFNSVKLILSKISRINTCLRRNAMKFHVYLSLNKPKQLRR
jgi:hypothetical protein